MPCGPFRSLCTFPLLFDGSSLCYVSLHSARKLAVPRRLIVYVHPIIVSISHSCCFINCFAVVMLIWLKTANIKRLKEVCYMGWKRKWDDTLRLAVFPKLKAEMTLMVIKQKKPVFPFHLWLREPIDVLESFD